MGIKINKLELANVKRVKAVALEPSANGLTIIGGKNRQGKTSILDAITWALGGNRHKPSEPYREGSALPPSLRIELSNGLIVERKGKNGDLKVIDPSGNRAGQTLLDSFISELALDLPRFMDASSKDKAETLLQIIGVGDQLQALDIQEEQLYNKRRAIGQIADQKVKFAREQPHYPDAPKELVSASELIREQQEILARNGRNQEIRGDLAGLMRGKKEHEDRYEVVSQQIDATMQQIVDLEMRLDDLKAQRGSVGTMIKEFAANIELAQKTVDQLQDESTAELEASIANVEEINIKVRANHDRDKAFMDAEDYRLQYEGMTTEIEEVRTQRKALLDGAKMPLPGLSVDGGELVYMGQKWDNMSGADRLVTSTAIVRALNPDCGFVLMDKLEAMDTDTLADFGSWLEQEQLQVIATRVSTGDECSIIIEDGYVAGAPTPEVQPAPTWKAGEF